MPTLRVTQTPLHCAAIDLGATSGRVIVGTFDDTSLTLNEVHRFPNATHRLGRYDYWDIGSLWTEIRHGLNRAAGSLPRGAGLASVGVDTWGVDHVLLNDNGRLVYPVHAYRDARTRQGLRSLLRNRADLARIYGATGIPPVFYNSSLQLAETIRSNPAITDLATRCLFLPDYFNYLLSGKMANGLAIASTTQLLDVHHGDWSREALDFFGVPPVWLTRPIKSGTKLGRVKGLPALASTQVIAVPGHDTACAFEAMPSRADDSDLFISSGTWSLVGFKSEHPITSPAALDAHICNERAGDDRYRPLTNVIGLWLLEGTLKDFASRPSNDREWMQLIKKAAALPRSRQVLEVDDPAFTNPPSMRHAIDQQLHRRHATAPRNLAGYVRLICDSLGREHAKVKQTLEQLSERTFHRILIVGGGARNALLCQATADAAGVPVVALEIEGSALGNIASQLIALRALRSFAAFRERVIFKLAAQTYCPLDSKY